MLARQVLYLLIHTSSPIWGWVFPRWGFLNYFPGLPFNHDHPELWLLSSKDDGPDTPLAFSFEF
jgi:hypothetical protein